MTVVQEPVTSSPNRSQVPRPRENSDVDSDRILTASVHVFDDVCEWVVDHFRLTAYRAIPPSYAVDTVRLVGQARRARRKKVLRDALLTCVLVAMVAHLESMAEPGHRAEALLALALTLALAWGVILLLRAIGVRRAMERVARRYQGRRGVAVDHVLGLLLLLALSLWWFVSNVDVLSHLLVFGGLIAAAWTVVFAERYVAALAAQRITSPGGRAPRPVPIPEDTAEQLRRIESADRRLVVYHHSRGFNNPFVGSGFLLHNWVTNIDVARGRPEPDGSRKEPHPVVTAELHNALLEAAGNTELPGIWYGRRTFVDGRYLRAQLRFREPRTPSVQPPYTDAAAGIPLTDLRSQDKLCRTYICVQIPSWDGDLIITLFIRAERDGANLHVTNKVYVLPPVAPRLHDMVYHLPQYSLSRLSAVATSATRNLLPMLLVSPLRTARVLVRPLWRTLRQAAMRYAVQHGARFDVGARFSVREEWTSDYLHSYAWDDVIRHLAKLETDLTSTIRDFLEQRNIDTAVLDQNISAMIHSQQNVFTNIGNLAFAKESRAGNTTLTVTSRGDSGTPAAAPPPSTPPPPPPSSSPAGSGSGGGTAG